MYTRLLDDQPVGFLQEGKNALHGCLLKFLPLIPPYADQAPARDTGRKGGGQATRASFVNHTDSNIQGTLPIFMVFLSPYVSAENGLGPTQSGKIE
eukprot:1879073-Amphidinium_carterae.3